MVVWGVWQEGFSRYTPSKMKVFSPKQGPFQKEMNHLPTIDFQGKQLMVLWRKNQLIGTKHFLSSDPGNEVAGDTNEPEIQN